jgi:hypothetical protein
MLICSAQGVCNHISLMYSYPLLRPASCCVGWWEPTQVEVRKYDASPAAADAPPPAAVVRACITKLPPGYPHIEVDVLEDGVWGQDGFDT